MNYEWSGREDLRFPRGTSNTTTHLSWMESQIRKGPPPHKPSPYPHTHTHAACLTHCPSCNLLCEKCPFSTHTFHWEKCMLRGALFIV